MFVRILYTRENLVELFEVDSATVKRWTLLGILPSLDCSPVRYDKKAIDLWVQEGKLDLHRPKAPRVSKGIY